MSQLLRIARDKPRKHERLASGRICFTDNIIPKSLRREALSLTENSLTGSQCLFLREIPQGRDLITHSVGNFALPAVPEHNSHSSSSTPYNSCKVRHKTGNEDNF